MQCFLLYIEFITAATTFCIANGSFGLAWSKWSIYREILTWNSTFRYNTVELCRPAIAITRTAAPFNLLKAAPGQNSPSFPFCLYLRTFHLSNQWHLRTVCDPISHHFLIGGGRFAVSCSLLLLSAWCPPLSMLMTYVPASSSSISQNQWLCNQFCWLLISLQGYGKISRRGGERRGRINSCRQFVALYLRRVPPVHDVVV